MTVFGNPCRYEGYLTDDEKCYGEGTATAKEDGSVWGGMWMNNMFHGLSKCSKSERAFIMFLT